MPLPTQTLTSSGRTSTSLSGSFRHEIRDVRLALADRATAAYLPFKLPPRSRVIMANIYNVTALSVNGGGTFTADCLALLNIGTNTAIATSSASNATASAVLTIATGTVAQAAGAEAMATGVASAAVYNLGTNEAMLCVVPMQASSNVIYPHTAATGMAFNGNLKVDVRLWIERFYLE